MMKARQNILNPPVVDLMTPKFLQFVDLGTPEPGYGEGELNITNPPTVDLVTSEPVLLVSLSTPS
jgi:hypothetical protein